MASNLKKMYEANTPILRCAQCNKPFDKQSTLKRHGYYCRSRKAGARVTIRSRSCISCAKAKARCDNRRPECSRCLAKGVGCHYPVNPQSKEAESTVQQSDVVSSATQSSVVDHSLDANPTIERDLILEDAFAMPDAEIANLDFLNPNIDFADLLSFSQTKNDKIDSFTSIMDSSSLSQKPSTHLNNQQLAHANSLHSSLSIASYLPIYNPRSLIQRPKVKSETQRISNLIFHTLKSYPRMMLQPDSLPPFIHPSLISESGFETENLEPLHNCISLVHMMNGRVRGSRKLFWRNVRMECERFCEEHLKMNKWELLAAMQALAIYIIIRLEEGETDDNHFDSLLVAAVTVISRQFNRSNVTHAAESALSNFNHERKWQDWVLEESSRRICVIYQVLNLLVYFEPADMCESHKTGLIFAQLPSRKQLWEANDEVSWKLESDRDKTSDSRTETAGFSSTSFGLTANGELVRVDVTHGQHYCSDDAVLLRKQQELLHGENSLPTASWEDWCSGMDGLGGLVMLAASLLG